MDLRSLQYFSVVAKELNFTRAAEKLNMSQPLPLQELTGQPLIVPHRRSCVDALVLAKANAGIGIFPQTTPAVMPGVVSRPIADPPKKAEYFLVWKILAVPTGGVVELQSKKYN